MRVFVGGSAAEFVRMLRNAHEQHVAYIVVVSPSPRRSRYVAKLLSGKAAFDRRVM